MEEGGGGGETDCVLHSPSSLCFTGQQLSVSFRHCRAGSPVLIRSNCQRGSWLASSLRVAIEAEAGF